MQGEFKGSGSEDELIEERSGSAGSVEPLAGQPRAGGAFGAPVSAASGAA